MCVCVWFCVRVHVCVSYFVFTLARVCVCVYVSVCLIVCIWSCVCVCVSDFVCECMCVCLILCVYLGVCVCVCVCVCNSVCLTVCIWSCVHARKPVWFCVGCACLYVCACLCVSVYVYVFPLHRMCLGSRDALLLWSLRTESRGAAHTRLTRQNSTNTPANKGRRRRRSACLPKTRENGQRFFESREGNASQTMFRCWTLPTL